MYSAIKKDGERLYDLARKGIEIERESRKITIEKLEIYDFDGIEFSMDVTCSAGTYIRSLARDIGEALQSGAYLTELTRTRIGDYKLSECIKIETFQEWLDKQ